MRPRKKQRHLPPCVYEKHGAFWYVKSGKWTRLADTLPAALERYAILAAPRGSGMVDLIEEAHEHLCRNIKPNTRLAYNHAKKELQKILVEFSPQQVRPQDVAAIKHAFDDRPGMGNRILSYLRLVFAYALERGIVDSNPCIGIKPHQTAPRRRYLTDEELAAILAHASDNLRPIVRVTFLTGQRIGDVLRIRLSDVTEEGIYFEQQKTGARLLIAMTPELSDAIREARALPRTVRSLYLFCTMRGARPYNYHTVKRMWQTACERAGIEDAHLHDLRAKSLTDAKKQGLDPVALGGHADPRMTQRYIRSRETVVAQPPSFRQRAK